MFVKGGRAYAGKSLLPEEGLGCLAYMMEVGEVQWYERNILACLFFELFDGSSAFLRVSGSHVHLCVLVHHFSQSIVLPVCLGPVLPCRIRIQFLER
jgi:hypothetical protein